MSYNNMQYEASREAQVYLQFSTLTNDFGNFQCYPQEGFGYPTEYMNGGLPITPERHSSTVAGCCPADNHPYNEEETDKKKLIRRIQNRQAASKCRRKKMERISELRKSLDVMYARSNELKQNIADVEAQIKQLKSAGHGSQNNCDESFTDKGVSEEPATSEPSV